MKALLQSFGAAVAGLAVAFVLVAILEMLSGIVHPPPEGFNNTFEEICQLIERYPAWLLAIAVVAWGLTALVSTWTTGKLGNRASALFVGLVLFALMVLNLSMLPYVLWFKVACLIVIPIAIATGCRLPGNRA